MRFDRDKHLRFSFKLPLYYLVNLFSSVRRLVGKEVPIGIFELLG